MKTWPSQLVVKEREIEREMPKTEANALHLECVFGPHKADLLHKGTAYCRRCYDERNRLGQLIN